MSWVGAEVWDVYFGERFSSCAPVGGAAVRHAHSDATAGVAAAINCVKQARRSWRRPRVSVWLSGALARPFMVGPIAGLRNWREALALAEHLAPEMTGFSEPCATWMYGLPKTHASVAVAMDRALLQAIVSAAATSNVTLSCVRPWWAIATLADAAPEPALLAAEDDDAITLLSANGDVWIAADCYAPKPVSEQLEPLLARRAFAMGVRPEAVGRVRVGHAPAVDGTARPGGIRVDSFAAS